MKPHSEIAVKNLKTYQKCSSMRDICGKVTIGLMNYTIFLRKKSYPFVIQLDYPTRRVKCIFVDIFFFDFEHVIVVQTPNLYMLSLFQLSREQFAKNFSFLSINEGF